MPLTLTARWVFPVDAPPQEGGAVTIEGERIVDIGTRPGCRSVDLGEAAILPGLVNAHTHLDLSGLRGRVPPGPDFTGWLRNVRAARLARTADETAADVRAGLAESIAAGTTLLGDIAAFGQSWPVLSSAPVRATVFYELLGLTQQRATQAIQAAAGWLREHSATPTCRPGLSPHAPYSVHRRLFAAAAQLAAPDRCALMTHLAESKEELQLLHDRTGPFVSFLQELGVWEPRGLVRRPEEVVALLLRAKGPLLLAHGNYLRPQRLPADSSVVYCPRTHAAFGHEPHPFRALLEQGNRLALGTDSLASNPDLSVLEEARFLRRLHPDLPGAALLHMATLSGARALGWDDQTGSLTPGKSADLVVLPLDGSAGDDPYERWLRSQLPVRSVLCRGRWISGATAGGTP